jgi:hypothetical protein
MRRTSDIPGRIDRRSPTVSLPGALRNPMRPPLRILPTDVREKPQFSLGFVRRCSTAMCVTGIGRAGFKGLWVVVGTLMFSCLVPRAL